MKQSKECYLASCKKTLEDCERLINYLFNGLLIEFVPAQSEYGSYIDLIGRLNTASKTLADVTHGLGDLALEVFKNVR